jgi:subtilisin family serine protease
LQSRVIHEAAALLAGLILLASSAWADESLCGPFEVVPGGTQPAECREPGVAPSDRGAAGADFVRLPAAVAPEHRLSRGGEALLALPKGTDGSLPEGLELAQGARVVSSYFSPVLCATVARVRGVDDAAPDELIEELPTGAAVVPNHLYLPAATEIEPLPLDVDPYRGLQYALDQIEVERIWKVSDGAGVTVALLDSHPDAGHADLESVRVLPIDPASGSAALHGTLMAGVIGAMRDNGYGIAGVAPGADLAAVPICGPQSPGAADVCPLYELLRGIDIAWGAQARVLNLSVVGPSNPLLERAVARLERLGVLVVAAAGNETTERPRYPAAYPSVLGVGAIDLDGQIYAKSNRGLSAQLFAPGVDVVSTAPDGSFAFGNGTSLAAAHVSGVAALLMGAGVEPDAARAALVGEATEQGPTLLAPACELLRRAGGACRTAEAPAR